MAKTNQELLSGYLALHDGLSDMIESGRLSHETIPDDYQWLVEKLEALAIAGNVRQQQR